MTDKKEKIIMLSAILVLLISNAFTAIAWVLTEVDNRELEQRIKICGCEK